MSVKKQAVREVLVGNTELEHFVMCPVCRKDVSLKVAWFDPYQRTLRYFKANPGAYVCYEHLSDRRKKEVEDESNMRRRTA